MVVFEDGLARKSEYRPLRHARDGRADTDWIAEAVRRRFARYLDTLTDAVDASQAARLSATGEAGRRRRPCPP